jgi:hypothetical protein
MFKANYKLLLAMVTLSSTSFAGTITGTVTLDGNVIHYQAYSGTDPTAFQQFLNGGTLTDFENVSGVTPLTVTAYNGTPTTAANLVDPKTAINGAFFSAGGQTPGNPANGGNPAALANVSSLNGAHSGTNVLAPTAQGDPTNPIDFNGFFSVNFDSSTPISRFGWWSNPNGGKVPFAPHINTFDSGGMLTDLSSGISFTANPGDFVAFAFDKSVIDEVELFQTGPETLDDFVYARDNALPIGGSTTATPEPVSAALLILGGALCVPGILSRRKSR